MAQSAWPASAGDRGTPGGAYVPSKSTPTPTMTPNPTGQPSITATLTPFLGPLPQIFISEFLADPKAVGDTSGEFVELFNPGPDLVNLRGWTLADLGSEHHTINADLIIPPGGYVVLAHNGDTAAN